MVRIGATEEASSVSIVGHGITLSDPFELAPRILIEPAAPAFDLKAAAEGCERFVDYAAVVSGLDLANFSLRVEREKPGPTLAIDAWNALWNFHLLSLATQSPVCSLFSVSHGPRLAFTAANRSGIMRPIAEVKAVSAESLTWAREHKTAFDALTQQPAFSAAMRCYGNAHQLHDDDMKIMLLWSGIEGLLAIDSELTRRIALYGALVIGGTNDEKAATFADIKKAYGIRSKAVHGGIADQNVLNKGYQQASQLLVKLLARCVEIGRVPTPKEMDTVALTATMG